jgi:hypothetical protein
VGNQVLRSGIRIAFAGGIRDCEKQIIAQRGLVGALRADASLRRARNQQNRQTAHTLRSLNQHAFDVGRRGRPRNQHRITRRLEPRIAIGMVPSHVGLRRAVPSISQEVKLCLITTCSNSARLAVVSDLTTCAIGIEAKSCSEFRTEEVRLLIRDPR